MSLTAPWSRLAGLALPVVLAGCAGVSEIVLAVNSDLEVPRELETLKIQVAELSSMGPPLAEKTWDLDLNKPGAVALPATVGLLAGDTERSLGIEVTGFTAGKAVISRRAELGFARSRTVLLRLDLLRSCLTSRRACPSGQTCTEAGCQGCARDAELLPDYSPDVDLESMPAR